MRATAARLSKRRDATRASPQPAFMIPSGKVLSVRLARMRSARAGQNERGSPPGRRHQDCNIGRIGSGFSSELRHFSWYVRFPRIPLFHPALWIQICFSNGGLYRFGLHQTSQKRLACELVWLRASSVGDNSISSSCPSKSR